MASVYSEPYRLLLAELIATRKSTEMTQAQLGEMLGRPQSFVSKFESGERRLDVVEFLAVCRALSADPYKIMRKVDVAADLGLRVR